MHFECYYQGIAIIVDINCVCNLYTSLLWSVKNVVEVFCTLLSNICAYMVLYEHMHRTHHHGIIFVHLGFSWNFLGLIFRIIGLVVFCQKIVDGLTDNFAVGLLVWDFTPEHVRLTTLWTIYCVLHRCIRLNSLTQTFPCCDSNLL